MTPFRDLNEHEIDTLSDEQILNYTRLAQRRGEAAAATRALCVLVRRYERFVMQIVRRKVKKHQVEEAFEVAMFAATRSALRNPKIDNFKAWLRVIVERRGIADMFRKHENDPDFSPLADENADQEDVWGEGR